jgi:hypothetical protein
MRATAQTQVLLRQLVAYFLLSSTLEVAAIPAPKNAPNTPSGSGSASLTPVTEIATGTDGKVVTGNIPP